MPSTLSGLATVTSIKRAARSGTIHLDRGMTISFFAQQLSPDVFDSLDAKERVGYICVNEKTGLRCVSLLPQDQLINGSGVISHLTSKFAFLTDVLSKSSIFVSGACFSNYIDLVALSNDLTLLCRRGDRINYTAMYDPTFSSSNKHTKSLKAVRTSFIYDYHTAVDQEDMCLAVVVSVDDHGHTAEGFVNGIGRIHIACRECFTLRGGAPGLLVGDRIEVNIVRLSSPLYSKYPACVSPDHHLITAVATRFEVIDRPNSLLNCRLGSDEKYLAVSDATQISPAKIHTDFVSNTQALSTSVADTKSSCQISGLGVITTVAEHYAIIYSVEFNRVYFPQFALQLGDSRKPNTLLTCLKSGTTVYFEALPQPEKSGCFFQTTLVKLSDPAEQCTVVLNGVHESEAKVAHVNQYYGYFQLKVNGEVRKVYFTPFELSFNCKKLNEYFKHGQKHRFQYSACRSGSQFAHRVLCFTDLQRETESEQLYAADFVGLISDTDTIGSVCESFNRVEVDKPQPTPSVQPVPVHYINCIIASPCAEPAEWYTDSSVPTSSSTAPLDDWCVLPDDRSDALSTTSGSTYITTTSSVDHNIPSSSSKPPTLVKPISEAQSAMFFDLHHRIFSSDAIPEAQKSAVFYELHNQQLANFDDDFNFHIESPFASKATSAVRQKPPKPKPRQRMVQPRPVQRPAEPPDNELSRIVNLDVETLSTMLKMGVNLGPLELIDDPTFRIKLQKAKTLSSSQ